MQEQWLFSSPYGPSEGVVDLDKVPDPALAPERLIAEAKAAIAASPEYRQEISTRIHALQERSTKIMERVALPPLMAPTMLGSRFREEAVALTTATPKQPRKARTPPSELPAHARLAPAGGIELQQRKLLPGISEAKKRSASCPLPRGHEAGGGDSGPPSGATSPNPTSTPARPPPPPAFDALRSLPAPAPAEGQEYTPMASTAFKRPGFGTLFNKLHDPEAFFDRPTPGGRYHSSAKYRFDPGAEEEEEDGDAGDGLLLPDNSALRVAPERALVSHTKGTSTERLRRLDAASARDRKGGGGAAAGPAPERRPP